MSEDAFSKVVSTAVTNVTDAVKSSLAARKADEASADRIAKMTLADVETQWQRAVDALVKVESSPGFQRACERLGRNPSAPRFTKADRGTLSALEFKASGSAERLMATRSMRQTIRDLAATIDLIDDPKVESVLREPYATSGRQGGSGAGLIASRWRRGSTLAKHAANSMARVRDEAEQQLNDSGDDVFAARICKDIFDATVQAYELLAHVLTRRSVSRSEVSEILSDAVAVIDVVEELITVELGSNQTSYETNHAVDRWMQLTEDVSLYSAALRAGTATLVAECRSNPALVAALGTPGQEFPDTSYDAEMWVKGHDPRAIDGFAIEPAHSATRVQEIPGR